MKRNNFKNIADEEIVGLYVSTQNNKYFEEIYDRYADKVYRKCYSFVYNQEVAEDLVHDIFLRLILKIGTFKEKSRFSTWLYSITYNYCLDHIRTAKTKTEVPIIENMDWEDIDDDDKELKEWQSAELSRSMEVMQPQERMILEMKYQEDFSVKEISETLKISESAVKMRLLRSREKLRKIYIENTGVILLIIFKILSLFND